MTAVRRLTTPPIAEAAVNFHVRLSAPIQDDLLTCLSPEFKARFPKAGQLRRNELNVQFNQRSKPKTRRTDQLQGFRFEGERAVTVFEQTQFLFSHVNHYESWEHLLDEAKFAWQTFLQLAKPVEITRVGLRYINKCELQLPAQGDELFTATPRLPEELNLDIGGYFSQITTSLPNGALANVTQMLQHEAAGSFAIIDVDVFKAGTTFDPSDTEAWTELEGFREWKNKIFFSLVTEKLLKNYL